MTNFPPDIDATEDSSRLLAQSITGDNAPPMSISQVSNLLKRVVEDQFGHVRLRGEISGYKRAVSGHVYLSLKDDKAKIDGIIWRGSADRLAFRPEDGIEVIVTGKLTTYPARSGYQIVIERMELAGEGALMQLFEKLKAKLAGEGLFDAGRKQPLPFLPRTIGVITSPTGAVIRDILHRLSDRCPTHVIVWPVAVQGEGAAGQVATALSGFAALPAPPDLIIVARGGGSIEDLWAFNEEVVVRAVAACPIPVISAVGHETDTTLCDFAADRRAPTPSAAAEMAVPVRAELLATVDEYRLRSGRAVRRALDLARERLANQARHFPRLEQLLQPQAQRVDDLADRLRRGLGLRIAEARGSLAAGAGALRPSLLNGKLQAAQRGLAQVRLQPALVTKAVDDRQQRLNALWRVAQQLHPDGPLQRGYVRVSADGAAVTSRAAAARHAHLLLHFGDGELSVSTSAAPPPRAKVKQAENAQPKLL